jgi:hypothetical protein
MALGAPLSAFQRAEADLGHGRMARFLVAPLALVLLLGARSASADTGESESSYDPGKATRRSDFAMGLLLGGSVGGAHGYPNELAKIGVPADEASTGVGAGTGGGFWLGGALRDWFVFGLGFSSAQVAGHGYTSNGTAFVLHLEGYPLFYKGGAWKDLGLIGEFGAGGRSIKKGSDSAATSGALSVVTFGVVYEPIHFGGGFWFGPLVEVTHQFSDSLTATVGIIGVRASFYGGPG